MQSVVNRVDVSVSCIYWFCPKLVTVAVLELSAFSIKIGRLAPKYKAANQVVTLPNATASDVINNAPNGIKKPLIQKNSQFKSIFSSIGNF